MPDPRKGEKKSDYIARFMQATKREKRSKAQRLAIAYSKYEKRRRS